MNVTKEEKPNSRGRFWFVTGCLLAAIGVSFGAIGAHFLEYFIAESFEDAARAEKLWETATRYLMYHALGMLAFSLAGFLNSKHRNMVGSVMLVGVLLFSGCLYAYVLVNFKPLVHIVPLGGFSMIIAWLMLAWFVFSSNTNDGA